MSALSSFIARDETGVRISEAWQSQANTVGELYSFYCIVLYDQICADSII